MTEFSEETKEWETEPDLHSFEVTAPSWMRVKSHPRKRLDKKWRKLYGYEIREVTAHCVVSRASVMNHLCGYVGLPKQHHLYKADGWEMDIEVHGGITFSNFWKKREGFKRKYWYIGFDAGHYMDYIPGLVETLERIGGSSRFFRDYNVYRNMAYMTDETMLLARQLLLPHPDRSERS